MQSTESIETHACRSSKDLVSEKEVIKSKMLIIDKKND